MSMQIEINSNIVKYLASNGYRSDPIIDELVKKTKELKGIAQMQIAPEQGQFFEIIVKLLGVKKCLEIGRFTGLSTLCLAKGLPDDGKIISIDNSDEFLSIAEKYWSKAGVLNKIESIIGQGTDVMQSYIDRQFYFDLIFIDADKNNYLNYYELSLQLLQTNGLMMIDNMLWSGKVLNPDDEDSMALHNTAKYINNDKRVYNHLIPIRDGLMVCYKNE